MNLHLQLEGVFIFKRMVLKVNNIWILWIKLKMGCSKKFIIVNSQYPILILISS